MKKCISLSFNFILSIIVMKKSGVKSHNCIVHMI